MPPIRIIGCLVLLPAALCVAAVSRAQWSSDPTVNLPVADGAGDQVQPKVAATADGGCYVSWFDNLAAGFDVRVQKLDAMGNEVLAHNGVLVADRSFSSTQGYGLDVDATGNALLAFRDDRPGGVQIVASKISPTGALLWGTAGVMLTNTADFVAAPKIAGTSDGGAVVAWTQDADVWVQKLDAAGNPLWGTGIPLTPGAGSYSVSDLHGAGAGAILAFVHQTGPFGSPRHLLAQKFDGAGGLLWGAAHVPVFDGGSLQLGNFPPFVPDLGGGGVFSWYDTSTFQFQCYAQHILADGSEAFPHNGAAASTNTTRVRVSPAAAFDPSTGESFLFWVEENSGQSQFGVYGQKFDAAGVRQWTDEGTMVVALKSAAISQVRTVVSTSGAFAFWSREPSFGQAQYAGARLDAAGAIDVGPFDVSSTPSGKSRLDVGQSTAGFAILTWSDDRNDTGDILAQNVNGDGTLGNVSTAVAAASVPPPFLALGSAHPNPMRTFTAVEFAATGISNAVVSVYDVGGRAIRSWRVAAVNGPGGAVRWDGSDARGRDVAPGVYFIELRSGGSTRTTRVAKIR